MAKLVTLTHSSGIIRKAYLGFSWTSLLFGPFPALLRGDFIAFFTYLFVWSATFLLSAGWAVPFFWLIWAFLYNRWHARRLIERGYAISGGQVPIEEARTRLLR